MISDSRPRRSIVGIELVRLLAHEGDRIFTTERARELAPLVGLKDEYVVESLYCLRRNGWIVSLHRGLYALSATVPSVTPAHEYEIGMALVEPAAISCWSASSHHGLTEQTPRVVFVSTTKETAIPRCRGKNAGGSVGIYTVWDIAYRFIQLKPERFFGTERVWVGSTRVLITDLERTLLDGLALPNYFGDFFEVLHAFQVGLKRLDIDRIIQYAFRLGPTIVKRLGWVLESQGVVSPGIDSLAAVPLKGYRTLDPTGPRKGPCNSRWMLQENLPGVVSA